MFVNWPERMKIVDARSLAGNHNRSLNSYFDEGVHVAIPSGTMPLGKVTLADCGAVTDLSKRPILTARNITIQRPIGMPSQEAGFLEKVNYPDITISQVENATCVPGGIIVKEDFILLESFSASWETYQHRHLRKADDEWFLLDRGKATQQPSTVIEKPVLFLDHQHLMWFGHFMLDLLTRAWAFQYCRDFLQINNLVVACSRPAPDFAETYFRVVGIPPDRILFFDQPIFCKSLMVATKALQIQEYTTPIANRLWNGVSNRSLTRHQSTPSRIYVSRRANPTRRLAEEEWIEEEFSRRGFVAIYPETLSISEQISLFCHAELIAGCSGSNMFNVGYAKKARSAFILVSSLLVHYQEHFLASAVSLHLHYSVGYPDREELASRPGYVHCTWHVDLEVVKREIDDWLSCVCV